MKHYIDKDTVVAEIERRKEKCDTFYNIALSNNAEFAKVAIEEQKKQYDSLLSFLDTLEVKEVDLDKELNKYFITNNLIAADVQFEPFTHLYNCAKHFFGLGLSSQLSWKDIELIAEIGMDFMNSEDSDNLNDEEYYTEILNRFKAQKGEYYDRQRENP